MTTITDAEYPYGLPTHEFTIPERSASTARRAGPSLQRTVATFNLSFVAPPLGLLSLAEGAGHILDAVKEKDPKKKALHSVRASVSASNVVDCAATTTNSLHTVGAIAKSAASWTAPVGVILFPFQVIGLGLSTYDTVKSGKLLHALNKFETIRDRKMAVLSSLNAVKSRDENIAPLMDEIRAGDEKALQKGESAVQRLKSAIKEEVGANSFGTALSITCVVLGILAIIGTGGLALLVAGCVVGLLATVATAYSVVKRFAPKQAVVV